jgi:hypothetical protein
MSLGLPVIVFLLLAGERKMKSFLTILIFCSSLRGPTSLLATSGDWCVVSQCFPPQARRTGNQSSSLRSPEVQRRESLRLLFSRIVCDRHSSTCELGASISFLARVGVGVHAGNLSPSCLSKHRIRSRQREFFLFERKGTLVQNLSGWALLIS